MVAKRTRKPAASDRNAGATRRARTKTQDRRPLNVYEFIEDLIRRLSAYESSILPEWWMGMRAVDAESKWLHTEECWGSGAPWCLQSCREHNLRRLGLPSDEEFLSRLESAQSVDAVDPHVDNQQRLSTREKGSDV